MSTSTHELNEALTLAAIACAERVRTAAETGGQGSVAETWAAAAAQLAYAANGSTGALPARPGLG